MSLTASTALIEDLVVANHILVNEGVLDGFGHISVRHDNQPDRFLIARSMAPGLVSAADIVVCDFDGQVHDARGRNTYVERFIHSEIYRARPDVVAVVHSHSASVIPFGVTGNRLRPIYHMAGFLGSGSSHFEIRDSGGDTDMLIRNPALGRALASSLGAHSCVLMRGHGSTVVGNSIEQVVYRAIYAEVNAKLQAQSLGMGTVNYLTEGEAELAAAVNDSQIARSWNLWQRRIGTIEA
jgi:ribulose-5-phosphate 4-epimerase/fuculose-1-phosphate aldolase